ncbi:hypothetical protein [Arthrobacter sp. S2(2024)]|uniref:hypothetical protein n=1 Tax=Arthrobacter sp. S2(2024) TaxID=3111911 RepID=UPI002FC583D5
MSEEPDVTELIELVQTRLGTTRAAAEDYVHGTILGEPRTGETTAAHHIQEALTSFRAMPALVVTPAPVRPSLGRLHQIMADVEWLTTSVERRDVLPTPDEIRALFSYAARMKVVAKGAGLEFEEDR